MTCIHDVQQPWAPLLAANLLFNHQVLRKPSTGLRKLKSRFVIIVRLSLSDGEEIRFLIKKQYL